MRPFCPTRWTVRALSLKTVMDNYSSLLQFLDKLSESDKIEAGVKASGLVRQYLQFDNYFLLRLMYKVLSRAETVASSIQRHDLDLYQTQLKLEQLKADVVTMRCDHEFDDFWSDVSEGARLLEVNEPKLPRPRKLPRRMDDNPTTQHNFTSAPEMYRKRYFDVIDTLTSGLDARFPSAVFEHMTEIEKFLTGKSDGDRIVDFYKDDLDADQLQLHRDMFLDIAGQRSAELASFRDALSVFKGSEVGQDAIRLSELLPELAKLFCLALTVPVTTSTAERSFSTLRRLKSYLRSTMTQERLNHMITSQSCTSTRMFVENWTCMQSLTILSVDAASGGIRFTCSLRDKIASLY